MRKSRIKRKMRAGEPVIGTFIKTSSPSLVEVAGFAGFDFIIIDREHGILGVDTMASLIRAAEISDCDAIVRVGENSSNQILRALDAGAMGVQVPHINGLEEARTAVAAAKYYPIGNRGLVPNCRASKFGNLNLTDYIQAANEEVSVILHVEDLKGIENIDDIVFTENVDVIFLGPMDISQALGFPGQPNHPKVVKVINHLHNVCQRAGVMTGVLAKDAKQASMYMKGGFNYIVLSSDLGLMNQYSRQILQEIQVGKQCADRG